MHFKKLLSALALTAVTALGAQQPAVTKRTMTLDECVRLALQHNLDIQIQRYNPQISLYQLNSSYGVYDPQFSLQGTHSSSQDPPGFDSTLGLVTPGSDSKSDSVGSGISGLLPWGLSYNLAANATDTTGTTPRFVTVTNVTGVTTNLIYVPFGITQGSVGFLQLQQPLMRNFWIDSSRLQIALSKRDLRGSELGFRQQVMNTVNAVENGYYNLIYSYDQVRVQEKSVELAARLLKENQMRVKVGSMAPLDEKQAESALAARRADLLSAQANLSTAQNTLRALLTDSYSTWYSIQIEPAAKLVAVPVALDLQESWTKAMTQRPDLEQARINVEKQDLTIGYQKNQLFPQVDVVGGVGYNGSSSGSFSGVFEQWGNREAPFYSFGAQVNIPLGNRAARNNYRAGKVIKEQLVLQLKQQEQAAMVAIDNSVVQVRTALERVTATREARVYAEAALDAEQKKLENGKSTSFEVLRLQNDLTSARSQEIRALADYNISLSNLALQEGATLDRNKIHWDAK